MGLQCGPDVGLDSPEGGSMKISRLGTLAFVLLLGASVMAQDISTRQMAQKTSHSRQTKIVRLTGKVSDDGTRFVEGASQRVWLIKNLEMLKGYEGQLAILKGETVRDSNGLQVLSIAHQVSYAANWGDSAFRR